LNTISSRLGIVHAGLECLVSATDAEKGWPGMVLA
jgi:hypothetical protein